MASDRVNRVFETMREKSRALTPSVREAVLSILDEAAERQGSRQRKSVVISRKVSMGAPCGRRKPRFPQLCAY